jgi:CheY-like chemotaxis protein
MDSVGSLASGLAHDFNNILSGILGNTQFLRRQLERTPEADEPLDTIERSVGMAAQLTRQLLGFARRDNDTLELIEPNPVLSQTLDLFRRGLKPGVRLEEDLTGSLPRILADPLQVGQALLNLLLNAADAAGESGVISLRTRLRVLDPDPVAGAEQVALSGPCVEFEIQDTGAGIPEDMLPRVFDPFFTTKTKGQGSGLGLAMVYAIIQRHGGRVEIQSKLGFGTRVRLLFPVPQADERQRNSGTPLGSEVTSAQIWVVDDDPVLRDMLRRILESLHYQVRVFETGFAVLEAVRREPAAADLFFLDVLMPGMSGVELLQELRGLRPDPRVVFCSGYTQSQQGGLLDLPSVKGFIEKPFSISSLSSLVAQALR